MKPYLDLLRDIRNNGTRKAQRATLSDGSKPDCLSVFGRQIRFNLRDGFPLVTTKRMPFKVVVHELVWFLRGLANVKYLEENNVKIWSNWSDAYGDLGPCYPTFWRHYRGPDGQTDQVSELIENIRSVKADTHHPAARRLLITAWHPANKPRAHVPVGCHTLAQWDVTNGRLSCQLYQRSADMLLGVPVNIACYSLFTNILAHITGLEIGEYIHTFGDAHIYENHLAAVDEQLTREPYPLPRLWLSPMLTDIDKFGVDMVQLIGYQSHGKLTGEVAV